MPPNETASYQQQYHYRESRASWVLATSGFQEESFSPSLVVKYDKAVENSYPF